MLTLLRIVADTAGGSNAVLLQCPEPTIIRGYLLEHPLGSTSALSLSGNLQICGTQSSSAPTRHGIPRTKTGSLSSARSKLLFLLLRREISGIGIPRGLASKLCRFFTSPSPSGGHSNTSVSICVYSNLQVSIVHRPQTAGDEGSRWRP